MAILNHYTATDQSINSPHHDVEEEVWEEFLDPNVEDPQWNISHYSTAVVVDIDKGDTYCTDVGRLIIVHDIRYTYYGYIEE